MKVFELLTDASKWTQKSGARNAAGEAVDRDSPDVVCRCLLAAIYFCYPIEKAQVIEERVKVRLFGKDIKKRRMGDCLSVWNDWHTFEDVRNLAVKMKI